MGKIMITADVQPAFVQIRLPHEHRDLTRLLWVKYIGNPLDKWNLKFRFPRVPFEINASPSISNMTIYRRMMDIGTPLATEIMSKLYVDNIILKANDADMAINKYKESKEYFRSLEMNLRDFISNNQEVNGKIASEDKAK
uniref:Reverse transcriptase domain-containing protein n=1 Tax=Heterorhabditis bacteriophora TaxID=37862 RepID=A0A1I7XCQ6_HETBA